MIISVSHERLGKVFSFNPTLKDDDIVVKLNEEEAKICLQGLEQISRGFKNIIKEKILEQILEHSGVFINDCALTEEEINEANKTIEEEKLSPLVSVDIPNT
jgi:hypothetical protein